MRIKILFLIKLFAIILQILLSLNEIHDWFLVWTSLDWINYLNQGFISADNDYSKYFLLKIIPILMKLSIFRDSSSFNSTANACRKLQKTKLKFKTSHRVVVLQWSLFSIAFCRLVSSNSVSCSCTSTFHAEEENIHDRLGCRLKAPIIAMSSKG